MFLYKKGDIFINEYPVKVLNNKLLSGSRPYVILQNVLKQRKQVHIFVAPTSTNLEYRDKKYTCEIHFQEPCLVHLEGQIPVNINSISEIKACLTPEEIRSLDEPIRYIHNMKTPLIDALIKANWVRKFNGEFLEGSIKIKGLVHSFIIPKEIYLMRFGNSLDNAKKNLETLEGLKLIFEYIVIEDVNR